MPRFYFDVVVNGERGADLQGHILDNAEAARREGLQVVKALSQGKPEDDALPASCELEILDEHRNLVVNLPFSIP